MDNSKAFIAQEFPLEIYNAKALLDLSFELVYLDDDDTETAFGFPGYVSSYLRVYDERDGQLLKNYTTQIGRTANILYLYCSVDDMTFSDLGRYFYELGYLNGGYEVPLSYGLFNVI